MMPAASVARSVAVAPAAAAVTVAAVITAAVAVGQIIFHSVEEIIGSFLRHRAVSHAAVKLLFDQIAPGYEGRNGGYTRILKLGKRRGDAAEMCILQLVEANEVKPAEVEAPKAEKAAEEAPKAE